MGGEYAQIGDIKALGIPLTAAQEEAAQVMLSAASSKLRLIARRYGRDIDELCAFDADYAEVVKNVVVQAVIRAVNSLSDAPAVTQGTESIGSYSLTATYLNAGQSLYFLRNELKDLGLLRQTFGGLSFFS